MFQPKAKHQRPPLASLLFLFVLLKLASLFLPASSLHHLSFAGHSCCGVLGVASDLLCDLLISPMGKAAHSTQLHVRAGFDRQYQALRLSTSERKSSSLAFCHYLVTREVCFMQGLHHWARAHSSHGEANQLCAYKQCVVVMVEQLSWPRLSLRCHFQSTYHLPR